jgi:antitoxin component of RelBE/YafQ-DinJ toxin-antitoxin module
VSVLTKAATICLRLDEKLAGEFGDMLAANGLGGQEALRLAIRAMVDFHREHGRIPRDMAIAQKRIAPSEGDA